MKTPFHLKSVLCGLTVGVCAVLLLGAGEGRPPTVGRYQSASGFGFLMTVDTATGQAWLANVATPGVRGIPGDFFARRIDKAPTDVPQSTLSVGRYQVTGNSGFFMITDSVTGQNWVANTSEPGFNGIQAGFYEPKIDR
jgi:hypothetical protein